MSPRLQSPEADRPEGVRGRPRLWSRDFVLLLAISTAFYSGFQLLLAPMPLYVVHLGGSEFAAGLVTGLFTLAAMLVRPLTGWALDVYGRRAVLILGTAACLLLIVAQGWAATIPVLLILRMVNGVGFGFATTAGGTIAADLVPRARLGEGMGFYAVSMGVALGVAPAIGIWLAGHRWFSSLFWVAAAGTAASLAMALLIRVPRPKAGPKMGARAQVLAMFVRPAVFPSALMFLLICGFGAILALLALLAQDRGIGAAGAWFTLYAFVLSLSRGFAGRASDRFGFTETAALGFVFAVTGLLLVASAHSLWLLLTSAVVFGIGFGTAQPCLQAMLVDRTPPERVGSATALLFFSYDLGTTVGSVGGGALAGAIGSGPVFVLAAVAPVFGLVLLLTDLRRSRRSVPTVVG